MEGTGSGLGVVRRIVERLDLEVLIDGVIASFADRLEFQALRPAHDELREWVQWNVDLAIRWFLDGQPPTEAELDRFRDVARASLAAGMPADVVPANYRLAVQFAWRSLLEAAAVDERAALIDSADAMFIFVDRVSGAFADVHDETPGADDGSIEERHAQGLLTRLTSGVELLDEDFRLAEDIGFNLQAPVRPFMLSSSRMSVNQRILLARWMRSHHMLAALNGWSVYGLANGRIPWDEADSGAAYAEGEPTPMHALSLAFEELRMIVDAAVARGRSGPIAVDGYLPDLLIRRSPAVARRIETRVYGTLDAELTRTLDVLIEHNFDRKRAAVSLPVHRNTLTNRINRIREMSGVDVDTAEGRALAWLAWLEHAH